MGTTRSRLRFPSPALIVALLALFVALGGGAYAATSASSGMRWTNATLENGWTQANYDPGTPGYAKDSLGVVHLRGAVMSGSPGLAAFVLPSALRPKHNLYIPMYTYDSTVGTLLINHLGDVIPSGSNSITYASLNGVSFVAGQ